VEYLGAEASLWDIKKTFKIKKVQLVEFGAYIFIRRSLDRSFVRSFDFPPVARSFDRSFARSVNRLSPT
jgi:hypothetical protein